MTTNAQSEPFHQRLGSGVVRRLARGAILLLPLLITFWLVQFAYVTIDGLLQPLISTAFGREIPGLSFGIIVAALFIVGVFSSTMIFKTLGYLLERGIFAVPGIGSIYSTAKKLLPGSEPSDAVTGFDAVVRVEYPRPGAWTVGFLMGVVDDEQGTQYGVVYMPSTPMPQSGWLVQVLLSEIEMLNWTSADAMQYIVSAGVTRPSSMETRMLGSVDISS